MREKRHQQQSSRATFAPRILVGITHPQTGIVLHGRLRALREAGFEVFLLASPTPALHSIAAEEGVEALPIAMHRQIAPLADLVSFVRICRALLKLRPDIAEFSTPKAGLLGSAAALLCGVPCRVYVLRGLRLETTSGATRLLLRLAERVASACSHVVLCNSESLLNQVVRLKLGPPGKLRILGEGSSNGVDIERFMPRTLEAKTGASHPARIPTVGFVGRLTRDKGIPELVEAFDALRKEIPDCRLLLVGWYDVSQDALQPELRRYIEDHPAILHTGFVRDTAPYYHAMDVMVLPTWREGFPNVALEAAASGIPVITTLATGSRDAVIPEVTGLLVPPGVPAAITEAMLHLLKNPERRQRMGEAARKWVIERFVNGRLHALTVEFYRDLFSARIRRRVPIPIRDAAAPAD